MARVRCSLNAETPALLCGAWAAAWIGGVSGRSRVAVRLLACLTGD